MANPSGGDKVITGSDSSQAVTTANNEDEKSNKTANTVNIFFTFQFTFSHFPIFYLNS